LPASEGAHGRVADRFADDAALIVAAATAAGAIALTFFRKDPSTWLKDGHSPVSEADIAANDHLKSVLRAARPAYGWLSEETTDTAERLARERVFIVDPIDGTRGFLAGSDEWVVSVALVERGRPIIGVLARPVTGDLFLATYGGGAWLNGGALKGSVDAFAREGGLRFAGPRKLTSGPALDGLGLDRRPFVPSLALRLARVATGDLDATIAGGQAHDWDLAAADLLVHEAGALLTTVEGQGLVYNGASTRHPPLACAAEPVHARLLAAYAADHAR
jgi:myo-inositol-1(or 4)-monophosphatase